MESPATWRSPWQGRAEETYVYTHALSLAGLGVHVSSLSVSMNAIILAQVNLNQNSIHCCFLSPPSQP